MMFFKYIDRYTIEPAPYPLTIDDEDYFTTDESLYNQYGYYRVEYVDYPIDNKQYKIYYIEPTKLQNYIIQDWEELPLSEYLDSLEEE